MFTGPIDAYFASKGLPKLEYRYKMISSYIKFRHFFNLRSIYFEKEYLEPTAKFFQPAWVVNYPEVGVNYFSTFLLKTLKYSG